MIIQFFRMRLYYLTSAQHAIANIALRRIKISRFADLNDPFELLGVNLANKRSRAQFRKLKERINANTGLICMSKAWKSPLMWGHYADKHRGICLGFDVDDARAEEVEYKSSLEQSDLDLETHHPPKDFTKELMRTKFSDWRYEEEVRVFVELKDKCVEGGLYFESFSESLVLKEVILGPECPVSRDLIVELISVLYPKGGVDVKMARIAFTRFEVLTNKAASNADGGKTKLYQAAKPPKTIPRSKK